VKSEKKMKKTASAVFFFSIKDKLEFIVLCKTFFEKKVLHSQKLSN